MDAMLRHSRAGKPGIVLRGLDNVCDGVTEDRETPPLREAEKGACQKGNSGWGPLSWLPRDLTPKDAPNVFNATKRGLHRFSYEKRVERKNRSDTTIARLSSPYTGLRLPSLK